MVRVEEEMTILYGENSQSLKYLSFLQFHSLSPTYFFLTLRNDNLLRCSLVTDVDVYYFLIENYILTRTCAVNKKPLFF